MTFVIQPTPVVVDASVVVALARGEEPALERVRQSWFDEGRKVFAPPFLWLELANALLRGRGLPATVVAGLLQELEASGIEVADRGPAGVRASLELAERHGLTVYDASYLWLAIDLDADLATTDRALVEAAESEDVGLAL